jgi:hypothetical protein
MTKAEEIAKGLSATMRKALLHKNAGGSAYGWASMATLEALRNRGLVKYRPGVGAFYSPHTAIEWPLSAKGLEVRALLKGQDHG